MQYEALALGDLFAVTSGGTPSRGNPAFFENGTIPWVKTGDLKEKYIYDAEEKITELAIEKSAAKVFPENTVLLAMYGATIGACSILRTAAASNQACAAFLPTSKVLPEFLYYYLLSQRDTFINDGVGGAQPNISGTYLKRFKIPLPPLETQKHIARVLEQADALRKHAQQMETELNQLAQSLFLEMFGDVEKNPKKWQIKEIGKIADVETGSTPARTTAEFYGGDIPWVKTGEVVDSRICGAEEKITDLAIKKSNCKIFPVNTVLVAMYGQGKTRGRVGLLSIPAATNQACAAILPTDNALPEFIFEYLKLQYSKLRALGRGGNQENLNLSLVKSFPIFVPPLAEQRLFVERKASLDLILEEAKRETEMLSALFDSLVQRAFKGELTAMAA